MYKNYIKRLLDFLAALVLMVVLMPVLLILGLLVIFTSKGPMLFVQNRVGREERLFGMLKFRSMRTDAPKDMPTHLLNDPYSFITPVGKFMRKTSLDELPQLWNILVGHMSFIGPRPALWNQYDLIAERNRYHANSVRPGLTGLAQIKGRDELPIPEKASYDGEYVRRISFRYDCSILCGTVFSVLRGSGVSEGGPSAKG